MWKVWTFKNFNCFHHSCNKGRLRDSSTNYYLFSLLGNLFLTGLTVVGVWSSCSISWKPSIASDSPFKAINLYFFLARSRAVGRSQSKPDKLKNKPRMMQVPSKPNMKSIVSVIMGRRVLLIDPKWIKCPTWFQNNGRLCPNPREAIC